jgi:hypothetical protein
MQYGRNWAFHYRPEDFDDSIARYNLRLRETLTVEVPGVRYQEGGAFGSVGGDRPPKPSDNEMHLIGTIEYDVDEGVLRTISGTVEELVKVRAELQEKVLRQAVIFELEKLGYTVISPEAPE